jgi:hypothetical protein
MQPARLTETEIENVSTDLIVIGAQKRVKQMTNEERQK